MNKEFPILRSFPIRKDFNLQAVIMQPLFLIKVSHNAEICEDHQQTILKRYLISAPNEAHAKHYLTLNILNSIEDLSTFSEQDLSNIYQILSYRFIRNENHINIESKQYGFKSVSVESVFIKQVKPLFHNNCYGYLKNDKIIDANFDLEQFKAYLNTENEKYSQNNGSFENKRQINVSMGTTPNDSYDEQAFDNLAKEHLSSTNQPESSKTLFEESNSPNETRWNREEFNVNNRTQFGNRPNRYNAQGNSQYRKNLNNHPDSAFQSNNQWLNNPTQPIKVTHHRPFAALINKTY